MSGSVAGRPGMLTMLAFLKKHRKENIVVIIDDISRLARGIEPHLKLRAEISQAGGVLESPSIEFGKIQTASWSSICSRVCHSISARKTASRHATECERECSMAIGCIMRLWAIAISVALRAGAFLFVMSRWRQSHYRRSQWSCLRTLQHKGGSETLS